MISRGAARLDVGSSPSIALAEDKRLRVDDPNTRADQAAIAWLVSMRAGLDLTTQLVETRVNVDGVADCPGPVKTRTTCIAPFVRVSPPDTASAADFMPSDLVFFGCAPWDSCPEPGD
jgi:hypothetical protein